MIVRNETNDPVEYEQNGPPPTEERPPAVAEEDGGWEYLAPNGGHKEFEAKGAKPYYVVFRKPPSKPDTWAWVEGIETNDVEVELTGLPIVTPI